MNIYGILIAKDEGDIIEQTLLSLREYGGFKKIFFYDNGSEDNTAKIAKKFNDIIPNVHDLNQAYSDDLKYKLLYDHEGDFKSGDWMVVLDADELLIEPIANKVAIAESNNSNCIQYSDAQFYFTELDDFLEFKPNVPAIEQRKHYLINYGEPRIFKYDPNIKLNKKRVKCNDPWLKSSPDNLLVNHFQFRCAQQTQHRIDVRLANNQSSNNWGHIKQKHWQDYLVQSQWLHQFNGTHIYGLPKSSNLYKIPDNPAYTSASLKWMASSHYLTEEQMAFFDASRLKKIVKKFF